MSLYFKEKKPEYLILAANAMASTGQYTKAIRFYEQAYTQALENNDRQQQKTALIGLSNQQFALDQYVRATRTNLLLLNYDLSAQEYEEVKASLVKSYAYRAALYSAYRAIPWNIQYTTANMVIAALQTTLWIGRGDLTKNIYTQYQPIIETIKPGSHLSEF